VELRNRMQTLNGSDILKLL